MRKVIYFFAAFLLILMLNSCKSLSLSDEEYYIHKDESLQDLEFEYRDNFN